MRSKKFLWSAIVVPGLIFALGVLAQDKDKDAARLAALHTRLANLERQIGLLEDSKAIKRLQGAYGYYLDKGLSHEVAGLFSDQATA